MSRPALIRETARRKPGQRRRTPALLRTMASNKPAGLPEIGPARLVGSVEPARGVGSVAPELVAANGVSYSAPRPARKLVT